MKNLIRIILVLLLFSTAFAIDQLHWLDPASLVSITIGLVFLIMLFLFPNDCEDRKLITRINKMGDEAYGTLKAKIESRDVPQLVNDLDILLWLDACIVCNYLVRGSESSDSLHDRDCIIAYSRSDQEPVGYYEKVAGGWLLISPNELSAVRRGMRLPIRIAIMCLI